MSRVRIGALLAASILTFAACGSSTTTNPPTQAPAETSGTPATTAPSESASAATGAAKDGGTLVVALPGDILRTDPALNDDSNSSYVTTQVIEGLVALKPGTTSEIVPALATSWELAPHCTTKSSFTLVI